MYNKTEEDIIFSKSMKAIDRMLRRVKIIEIVNNPNCHLSLNLQQELTTMVEEMDMLEHAIAKQNIAASKSTLLTPPHEV